MVPHLSRDTDAAGWTFGLKPCRHIHDITVDISAIWNHIAYIDADAKTDGSIGRLITVVDRHLLLHFGRTAHCSLDAVEHDEQGIASRVDDPAAVLIDRWVDQVLRESAVGRACQRRPGRSSGNSPPCPCGARRSASADPSACRLRSVPT